MLYRVEHSRRGPRIVLVHGFTQTHASWRTLAADIGTDHAVQIVDLPGHGGSGNLRLDFEETAQAIWDCGGADATYVGYSMGGRLCLQVALDHPIRSLVMIGASPGLADERARAQRRGADEHLADEIEHDGTRPFLDAWLAQPMFARLRPTSADLSARYANSPQGLAYALRRLGPGAQPSLWDRLNELSIPTLLVAGDRDHKYVSIANEMAAQIGMGRQPRIIADVACIANAGHAAHLEQPTAFARLFRTLPMTPL